MIAGGLMSYRPHSMRLLRGVCDEANKGGPCYLDWEVFLVGFLTLAGIFPSTVRVANCARNQCVNRQRPQQKDTVVKQSYEQEGS